MTPNILAIMGPTATGKTGLFVRLVQDGYNFQAISADSRQVYKYMDIGTGKDLPSQPSLKRRFWLIDAVNPDQSFSSSQFYQQAMTAIGKIYNSGDIPVIVGGTGRYIKDLESPPETLQLPPDQSLRQKLASLSVDALQQQLCRLNKDKLQQMNHSDQNNPRRLVRAIEVAVSLTKTNKHSGNIIHKLCLTAPLQLIEANIRSRITARMKQGMIEEVMMVINKYPSFTTYQSAATPGYQEIIDYLNKDLSLETALEKWLRRELAYAKRQLTWFKYQTDAKWFDITDVNWYAEAVKQLEAWGYGARHPQN